MRTLPILCFLLVASNMLAQQLPKIKGSGVVVLEEKTIEEPIDVVTVDGDIVITLSQGKATSYTIETDDNLVAIIDFEIEDNTLKITANHRITKKKKLDIHVKMNAIKEIHLDNGARMESDELLKGDNLRLTAGSASKFEFDLEYKDTIDIEMYSNADGLLKAKTAYSNIALDSRTDLDAYFVTDSLTIQQSDTSKLKLDGSIENATIKITDNAKLEAKEVGLTQAAISLSDTSDAVINTKEQITVYLEDSATIALYGDPEITVDGLKNKAKILKKE